MGEPVASVRGLRVAFGGVDVLHGLDLDVWPGRRVGLLGESGSGKTLTASALLGLLPRTARASGSVRLRGREMLGASQAQWRRVRGAEVGLIAQDPRTALNPLVRVGDQAVSYTHLDVYKRQHELDKERAQRDRPGRAPPG